MKKTLLLFVSVLFVSAGFVACSSDDNKGGSDSHSLIVGKWEFYKETEYVNGELEYDEAYDHSCPSEKDYVEFGTAGEFIQVNYNETCQVESESATYSLSGDHILINSEDEEDSAILKIITLNSSKLIVESEEEWEGITYKFIIELRK